ncbi:MAG: hypothetical protein EOO39_00575 [Cytophagaceae bacterium]|nr:MAG: hypothetical protein EOO39_00575 [Cytophagaceae bacterium]
MFYTIKLDPSLLSSEEQNLLVQLTDKAGGEKESMNLSIFIDENCTIVPLHTDEYRIEVIGVDNSQNFLGRSAIESSYDMVTVGCGDNAEEAYTDALQSAYEQASDQYEITSPIPDELPEGDYPAPFEGDDETGEIQYYVAIFYNTQNIK